MKKPRSRVVPGDLDRLDARRVRARAVVEKSELMTQEQVMEWDEVKRRLKAALAAGCSYEECARALQIPAEVIKDWDIDA